MKFLVDLRADELRLAGDPEISTEDAAALTEVGNELQAQLAMLFDVGLLELRRITWDAPAALLEKLIEYEAVHTIDSWADLKNRLDSDRRCYAFFHPAMPDEPLVFVEIALTDGHAVRAALRCSTRTHPTSTPITPTPRCSIRSRTASPGSRA